ncbi:MAG: prephenate dehydrogenase/arogenate dehydrogenase family protein [Acidimicrobiales bacterium]
MTRRANVVGLGLIGGSVASALQAQGWHVTGSDCEPDHEQRALEVGLISEIGTDSESEISFVATPVSEVPGTALRMLNETVGVVTDTGSVKSSIAKAVTSPRFVPGHPMAGSELVGLGGADASLFDGAVWVLTPAEGTPDSSLALVRGVVSSFGTDVVTLSAERHDSLVAVVSHVPHLTAATLMWLADERAQGNSPMLRLAAGGFRDMTRIAAGDPGIWPDICLANRSAILDVLNDLGARIERVRSLVESEDREGLLAMLAQAHAARVNLPNRVELPAELSELRVPIPDRKGELGAITMLATDLDVDILDIEIAHTAEGTRGVLILIVTTRSAQRLQEALAARGYRPSVRELE